MEQDEQRDLELNPEELEALNKSEVLDQEEPTTVETAETTPAKGKMNSGLHKWNQRVYRGRQADIDLLSKIETFREYARSLPSDVSFLVEEMIHFAGYIFRAVNYWKESSQNIPVSEMFDHVEKLLAKPYDRQVFTTFYMDGACRQVLFSAAKVPLTPELRSFVIRALERGVYWMKRHPQNIDGLPEIEEGLRKFGGTVEVVPSSESKKIIRKPKPVIKPAADWLRLVTKLGHPEEAERRQREYEQYKLDMEEYKRAVKLRRKENKEQF